MVRGPLFEATDCANSALALNCLQVSCCLPDAPAFNKANNSKWMERLGNINSSIMFRDLILIGAHDSASFSISNAQPYSAVSKCQHVDTAQQLQAGVRILDVRLATAKSRSVKSKIAIWHGCVITKMAYVIPPIRRCCCRLHFRGRIQRGRLHWRGCGTTGALVFPFCENRLKILLASGGAVSTVCPRLDAKKTACKAAGIRGLRRVFF